jgi:hypothetical protein
MSMRCVVARALSVGDAKFTTEKLPFCRRRLLTRQRGGEYLSVQQRLLERWRVLIAEAKYKAFAGIKTTGIQQTG